ncbi:MAG: thioesterase family protein [Pseudonocardiaceae bacterium]
MTATYAGLLCAITRTVTEADLATELYPDLHKPPVLATARLLRWCEHAAMGGIDGCAVGAGVSLRHLAPAVLGSTVAVNACCTAVDGPRSRWSVTVHDAHELIATGELWFVVVDPERYRARLESKRLGAHPCRNDR